MCDCFHLAFPNWHAASSGTGGGRRLRGPEPGTEDDSICDEPSQFAEGERPRPQGSSPVEEFPETEKYTDSDKECEAEHDPHHKSGSGKKTKKSGLGSMFEKRSTPKMSKLKEVPSPESGVIVKTAKDGCAEGLVYAGGGKEGIFIKEVVPESPASKSLKLKEGDQILSATVYFDNMSYEDAIQILEHAQAYKVKLCLKRKPDITETEPTFESDVIPEDEVYAPEMREQGKTKRRGDARISWPKFPSFGKGRKSRFTRSHSSSEADEQRKLELSPTTSDTESPIKSQDALKGKKKNKVKLSLLTKRGRISSSEDQDTDTTGQMKTSEMLSPECLESPSGETQEVYVTAAEDSILEQNDQKMTEPQTVQHKVELISVDSTLKTADLTVAMADKESSSGIKSPDGKKKKKERSELKMKILGKDKSHKKDSKAKSSPKRLKTLGASIEIPDQPENEKSLDANTQITVTTEKEMSVPKVELDIPDAELIRKSPQKGDKKHKKGKDIKQQETKTGPAFKLPNIDLSGISTEETVQKMNVNVEEYTSKIEHLTTEGTEVKEDPYEQLSKRTQLPKREEIEIPGMEDMSMRITAKGHKVSKAGLMGDYEELQAETVQMSIDVDSVKEAVSKLPGYKLPRLDTSGIPIPEEITVIDANAQRISVKTPTKVVDTKTKHEAHFSEFGITSSQEISKTTIKLPKMTPADLTSEELLIETKVDLKTPEKKYKSKSKQSDKETKTEVYKREDIIIPGKESAQEGGIFQTQDTEGFKSEYEYAAKVSPKKSDKISKKAKITAPSFGIAKPAIKIPDIGIDLSKQKGDAIFAQEEIISKTEARKGKGQIGGVISDVKIPEIDGIEYIDSVGSSPTKRDGIDLGIDLDAVKASADISIPGIRGEVKDAEAEERTIKLPKFGAGAVDISVDLPHADKSINIDGGEIKTFEREGKGSKFKMPNLDISMPKVKGPKIDLSLSKKDVDVTLPEAEAEVKLPDVPEVDVTRGNIDVSIPEQKMEVGKPELEIKALTNESELDVQGDKFKMPKFGIKMPKIKGPELDLSLSKKDADVTLPDAKAVGKLPEAPDVDITLGSVDVSIPQQKMKVKKPDGEHDGQGSKFKMPKFGITMPKVKGPEFDLSFSKKDGDVTLPEAKAEVKLPDVEYTEPSMKAEVKAPEIAVNQKDVEGSPSKFKMPTFKLPKFGVGTPSASIKVPDMDKDVKIDGADIKVPEEVLTVEIAAPSIDTEGPLIHMKTTGAEHEGKGSKFKMPSLGFSVPQVKRPDIDLSLSKKDVDVTLPEASAEVKLPEAPKIDVSLGKADVSLPEEKLEVKKPELEMKPLQSEVELDSQGSKFKMPKFGMSMPKVKGPEIHFGLSKKDGDVTLPEAKAEVKVPEVELKEPSAEVEIKAKGTEGSPSKFKMPTFKLPKFGVGTPNVSAKVPDLDKDVKIDGADIKIPEEVLTVDIAAPSVDIVGPSIDIKSTEIEQDGKESKFKMPHLGFSMPKVKGPKIDLSLSKKDIDVTLPEAKADVTLPEVDVSIPEAKMDIPEAKVEVKLPEAPKTAVEMKPPEFETEMDDHGGKFKIPKFGIKMPKVKGPEFDLSLSKKEVDVNLPEVKADVKLPDAPKIDASLGKADISIPEAKVGVKKPEVEIRPLQTDVELEGQGGKFKMPKFGITMPKIKGPEIDLSFSKKDVDVTLPEVKAEVDLPEAPKIAMDVKPPEIEAEIDGQGSKFKVPKFGISLPKVQGPEIDVSLSKKDVHAKLPKAEVKLPEGPEIDANLEKVDVSIPEAKMEVKKSGVEIKPLQSEGELDVQGGKFKMPKIGMAMPKVQGPEIDFSLSKKDVDITLPEVKADVKLPDVELKEPSAKVEIKAPEIEAQLGSVKGSPSKFKMPTFKFPKFGVATPNVSAEVPDIDKEIKIDGADMPHTDVDVPKVKAEVHLPEVEVKEISGDVVIEQQQGVEVDAKMKKPRFSLPKFSFSKPSVKAPEVDVSLPDVNVTIPEGKVEVKGGEVDMKSPECEAEVDGQGSKFQIPKFGITMPKVTGPKIDLSLSKKDVDVTLPEAKAEVKLPDVELKEPSIGAEIKAPEIKVVTKDTEGSPSKIKMPTIKLPKFGVGMPSATVEVPDMDKDVKIDGADIKVPEEVLTVEIAAPSIDTEGPSIHMKTTGVEHEGKGGKFDMPKFGITMPTVALPEIDLSLSKKDVDVTLPEAKAEVKLPDIELKEPSAEVEIKAPEIKVVTKDTDGSPSKFKMPTFKLPTFGAATPQVSVEVPDVDKEIKVDGKDLKLPQTKAEVKLPDVEIKEPEEAKMEVKKPGVEIKPLESEGELDVQGGKFKMPKIGMAMPKVQGPEIDFSLSKKDVDITLPEVKADVKLPDVELKEPSAKVEVKAPEIEAQLGSVKGSPSKFKMPTFKFPKFGVATPNVSAEVPDIDKEIKIDGADMPHTDVDVPKVKAEVHLPEVEVKEISGDVVIEQQPGVEVDAKMKKPRFSLPKFSFSKPSVKAPEVDVSLPDVNVAIPEGKVEVKGGEVDMKSPECEAEVDGQGSKFQMPKFGITMSKVTGPKIDLSLSKKDVDVTLPEAKAEVKLPDVELKEPSAEVEIKAPEIKVVKKETSPSKFKMPTIKLPKFGVGMPSATVEVPDMDKDVKIDGADVKVPEEVLTVEIAAPSIDTEGPSIHMKTTGVEHEGKGGKFKMPSLGFSVRQVKQPDIDLGLSKKDVDVTLPQASAEGKLPDVELKDSSVKVEIKAPEIDVQTGNVEGSPSKFKMPTFKLPTFGAATPQVSAEVPDVDKEIKVDGKDLKLPQTKAEVKLPDVEIKEPEGDAKLKKTRFSFPKFSFSKQSTNEPEVDVSVPDIDVSLPEGKVEVKQPEVELKPLEGDVEIDGQGSKFKMPKFGISMPKVKGPEIDLSLSKKDADVTIPEAKAEIKIKGPEIEAQTGGVEGSPSKLKMPTFTLPKFGGSAPKDSVEVPDLEKDIKIDGAAASIDTKGLSVDVKAKGSEVEGSGSKFKMPKFGISVPKVKGPEVDLSLSKKDADVTLPEAKAEIKLPDVKVKQPSAKVEIKGPEIEAQKGSVEGSPSKLKMPTFTLPKFGGFTPKDSVEVPDVEKDIKIDGAAASIDTKGLSVDVKAKGSEVEGSGSKFKMPNFGISVPKVKGPEVDLSLSKKDADVTLQEAKAEVKLPSVQLKEPEGAISVPDAPTVDAEVTSKRPGWTFPKFSFSKTGGKAPDVDASLETPKVDVTSPEAKAEISLPDVKVQGSLGAISTEEPPAVEPDANLKKSKFSLFSFSKSSAKTPEVSTELPHVDVSLPEGEVKVKQPEMEIKAPEIKAEHGGQGSKFKLPKFGIELPKAGDSSASQKVDITLPEVKAEIKLPETEAKSASVEIKASEVEVKSKDVGGSPLKFKMPTMKTPKFDVTVEASDAAKVAETDGSKLKEDAETPKTETDSVGLGSPSKFKLPSFKMPRLSFSKPKPEDEYLPVETECKEEQLAVEVEPKDESKSPKMTLTTFGEILKNIDVEFDVPKTDTEEENLETSKEANETDKPSGKPLEPKEKETETKQETIKTPERTGWFKFPRFGLSSPSGPAKATEKDEHKDAKSPVGETVDDELSPTCSVQSSDAFADISSAMTSEHAGLSLSSPTKVTVKYSDPNTVTGLGETHSNIITSTTRTELISVEPNLPEKITILSSGVSSSSEDTLRLEAGKIHVITSNIQATPDTQHAKVLTAVQVQSSGGPALKSETNEAASWAVEDSQSGKTTVFERHLVRETSTERSEGKETIVITKQFTHIVESSEPISGETASSIQRLRDTVHSEKMKFFDGDEE
ncbi:uncharacterized protein ABDE67_015238 [Symphorus nematophorus]